MTEARIDLSIVTTNNAVGYPECEALTAHPLALYSKRCDGRAEVRRADERSESSRNALFRAGCRRSSPTNLDPQFPGTFPYPWANPLPRVTALV
jgi:hypothetical protein